MEDFKERLDSESMVVLLKSVFKRGMKLGAEEYIGSMFRPGRTPEWQRHISTS